MKIKLSFAIGLISSLCLSGCDLIRSLSAMESVDITDPKIQAFSSMNEVDRTSFGFSPLPTSGKVKIEKRFGSDAKRAGYNAMLHFYGDTARTIAFVEEKGIFKWIGEQESFEGPSEYVSGDGKFREIITVTYYPEPSPGQKVGLNITYWGEDPRFANKTDLKLDDVKPILLEWRSRGRAQQTN